MGTLSFKEKTEFAKVLSQDSNLHLSNSKLQFCTTHPKTSLRTNGSSPHLCSVPLLPIILVSALLLENKCQ